jgi:hypothetical protein
LITAESGEISENLNSVGSIEAHTRERERLDSEYLERSLQRKGVIGMIYDLETLTVCLSSLVKLRDRIKDRGFQAGQDRLLLTEIYGKRNPKLNPYIGQESGTYNRPNLFDDYETWLRTAEIPEDERQKEGYASPARCREKVLSAVEREIERLKAIFDALKASRTHQTQLEELRRTLPEPDRIERLLRYEASLERAFDRTLLQLERLQRMRLGQPVTPPVKIDITS